MTFPSSLRKKQIEQAIPQQEERIKNFSSQITPQTLRKKEQIQKESTPSFETDEDLQREIERGQAVVTSRMIERLLGIPGDISSLIPEKARKFIGFDVFPTSSELKKKSEELSLGYTKPKTEFEEKAGEFAGDVASFAIGSPAASGLGTIGRIIGIPLAGQLAREGVEKITGSKKGGEYAKLGTMLITDLIGLRQGIGKGGSRKFGFDSLETAEKSIPKGSVADVSVFENKLNKLESSLKGGITGPHTSEALRSIDEIKSHIKNGQMEASLFPRLRKDINKLIENLQGFSFGGPPKSIKRASVHNLNQVKSSIIQAGNRWGRKNSPEFFKSWKEGNEALSVYYKSRQIGDLFSRFKPKNLALKIALGTEAIRHPGISLGLKAGEKITKGTIPPIYRFFASPVLRKLYLSTVKEAVKGNVQQVGNLINKMDKIADKEKLE